MKSLQTVLENERIRFRSIDFFFCGSGSCDLPTRIHFPIFTRELKYDSHGCKFARRDLSGEDEEHITFFSCDPAGNLTALPVPSARHSYLSAWDHQKEILMMF